MAIRTILYELEAKLKPTSGGFFSKPSGKLERKSYEDQTERLKIAVRNIKVPDGTVVKVTADGKEILGLPINDGRGKYDEESKSSATFPALELNQTIGIIIDGEVILSGIIKED